MEETKMPNTLSTQPSSSSDKEDTIAEINENLLMLIRRNASVKDVKRALLSEGIQINYRNVNKDTFLHVAVRQKSKDIVDLLLSRHIDITIRNQHNKTALKLVEDRLEKTPNDDNLLSIKTSLENAQPTTSTAKRHSDTSIETSKPKKKKRNIEQSNHKRKSQCKMTDFYSPAIDESIDSQPEKRSRTDPELDINQTYNVSGSKLSMHGVLYQSKLLGLFAKRGTKLKYDFRLATEMDAAGKFDDIVLKYYETSDLITETTWRFLQAKHKQNPTNSKISINDLTSSANKNPFSLQKYFISVCKIMNNEMFKNATFNDFTIITNAEFDFLNYQKDIVKIASKNITEIIGIEIDWLTFFEEQNDLTNDEFLFIECNAFKARKFKINQTAEENFIKMMKFHLLHSIFATKEITRLNSVGRKLNSIRIGYFKNKLKNAKYLFDKITEEVKNKKRISIIRDKLGRPFLNLMKSIETNQHKDEQLLSINKCADLKVTIEQMKKNEFKEFTDKVRDIFTEVQNNFETQKANLNQYDNPNSEEFCQLAHEQTELNKTEIYLRELRKKLSISSNVEWIKNEMKQDTVKLRIPKTKLDELNKNIDFDLIGVKESFDKILDNAITEIAMIQVALNYNELDHLLKEFLTKFRFVTNYFDEKELGEHIKDELGNEFNLTDADLVYASFQIEMIDFHKEYDSGKATFYTWKKGEEFYLALKNKLCKLQNIGLTKAHIEKLNSYGVHFTGNRHEINRFLRSEKQICHFSSSYTRLGAINILQIINDCNEYTKDDSFIFIEILALKAENTRALYLESFSPNSQLAKTNNCCNLFVLECQHKYQNDDLEWIDDFYKKLSHILKENPLKKLILIAQDADKLVKMFKNQMKYQKVNGQFRFDDLHENSQQTIRNATLQLFDNDITFDQIIDENCANEIIDEAILWRILEGDKFVIGNKKENTSLDYVEDYYISRHFNLQENPIKITTPDRINEDTLISCTDKVIILSSEPGEGKSTVLSSVTEKIRKKYALKWVVRIDLRDYAIDQTKPLSLYNVNFQTNEIDACIDFISKMVIQNNTNNIFNVQLQRNIFKLSLKHSEQKLKIVILLDGFDEISPSFKDNTTQLINAIMQTHVLQLWITTRTHEKDHLNENLEIPIHYFHPLTIKEQKTLLTKACKWHLKFNKNCQMKSYREMINYLNGIPNKSFDEHLNKELSKMKQKFPIDAINKCDQLVKSINKLSLTKYINKLFGNWKNARNKKFICVPLHLKMLTEIVLLNKFAIPKERELLYLYQKFIEMKLDIYYDKSGANKCNDATKEVFRRDKQSMQRNYKALAVEILFPKFYAENLALHQSDLPKFKEQLEHDREDDVELFRTGIVTLKGDQLEFVHRSYAEYFLSEYLIDNLTNESVIQELLIEQILIAKKHGLIRQFFNDQLKLTNSVMELKVGAKFIELNLQKFLNTMAKEGHTMIFELLLKLIQDNHKLYMEIMTNDHLFYALRAAIQNGNNEIAEQIIELSFTAGIFKNTLKIENDFIEMPLYDAIKVENIHIVEFILNKLHQNDENLTKTLVQKGVDSKNALYVAVGFGKSEMVTSFMKWINEHLGEDFLREIILSTDYNMYNENGYYVESNTGFHHTIQLGQMNIACKILNSIKKYTDILEELMLITNHYGATVLRQILNGQHKKTKKRAQSPKELLNFICNISECSDEIAENIAVLSVYGDSSADPTEFFEKLTSVLGEISKIPNNSSAMKTRSNKNKEMGTSLATAITPIKIYNNLKKIKDNLENVKSKRNSLDEAINNGDNSKVMDILNISKRFHKELLLATNDSGWTVLHKAADQNRSDIIEILLESVKDHQRILRELVLKVSENEKETALHRAASHGHDDSIFMLLNCVHKYLDKDCLKMLLLKPLENGNGTVLHVASNYSETVDKLCNFVKEQFPVDFLEILTNMKNKYPQYPY